MTDLRKLAEGQSCYLRMDGCSHDPAKTVLAHIRRGGIAGRGQKPPDICALPLDSNCHDIVDGRVKSVFTRAEIDAELLRALVQWQAYLWRQGFIYVRVA